jgi:hypothetical protein
MAVSFACPGPSNVSRHHAASLVAPLGSRLSGRSAGRAVSAARGALAALLVGSYGTRLIVAVWHPLGLAVIGWRSSSVGPIDPAFCCTRRLRHSVTRAQQNRVIRPNKAGPLSCTCRAAIVWPWSCVTPRAWIFSRAVSFGLRPISGMLPEPLSYQLPTHPPPEPHPHDSERCLAWSNARTPPKTTEALNGFRRGPDASTFVSCPTYS